MVLRKIRIKESEKRKEMGEMEVGLEFNDFVSYACVDLLHYCYYSSWILSRIERWRRRCGG
ncbi:hypothetical protein Hanom_Chr12g01067761 [Helianthus anomalus]